MADAPLYLPPREELSQGDIYLDVPSIFLTQRPLRVARLWRESGDSSGRATFGVHNENGQAPDGGFKWRFDRNEPGEEVLARAHLSAGVLLTHDCEIDKDEKYRTLAMLRPMMSLNEKAQEAVLAFKNYSAFPLEAQETNPPMAPSFIDFRRLTTMRPLVLEQSSRHASMSDELRDALAEAFHLFLFRRVAGEEH